MSRSARHVCERCQGVLSATRRTSLEQVIVVHEASCPSAVPRVKSRVRESNPPPVAYKATALPAELPRRKRIIPRRVVVYDDDE